MSRRSRSLYAALALAVVTSTPARADTPNPTGPHPPPDDPGDPRNPQPQQPEPPKPEVPKPEPEQAPEDPTMAKIRSLYDAKDFVGVRRELIAAYQKTPDPALLFALGQVEIQLEHYQAAIDYYEKFIAAKPPQDQIDLAQQAIAAARLQIAKQKPPRHRYWTGGDTALVITGGAAIAAATGAFVYAHHMATITDGTLTDYDHRLDRARLLQISAVAAGAAGAVTIGLAIARWRLRPEDGYELSATATGGGGTVWLGGRW